MLFSACIPSEATPPGFNPASGAAAVVTRDTYRNDLFSLEYPAGWRVITSPVGAPPGVTLVAPGDCALIVISSTPLDAPPAAPACDQPNTRTVEREIALQALPLVVAGSAPAAGWDGFIETVDRVVASLQAVA